MIKPVRKKVLVETILRLMPDGRSDTAGDRVEVVSPPARLDASSPGAPAVVPTESAPLLDYAAYAKLVEEIGESSSAELLDVFFEETLERLELLRRLTDMSDRSLIEREAHSLKGAAATFGFSHLAQLARTLQLSAQRIDAGEYAALLARIEPAFASAREQLATRLGEAA